MKWWKIIIDWLRKFFMITLPLTQDGNIDATKVILAVIYEFNGKKVFRISIFDHGAMSDHWVEWSQQLENWLMMSGVNVTENISIQKDFNAVKEQISNLPSNVSDKSKIKLK